MKQSPRPQSVPSFPRLKIQRTPSRLLTVCMSLMLTLALPVMAGKLQPPAAPTGLTATAASASQINLAWNSSAGANGYYVERLNGSTWSRIATVSATSYSNTGLTGGTTYNYRVLAYNSKGTSTASSTVSATTLVAQPPPCSYTLSPTSASYTSAGGSGSIGVAAGTGCAWTATDSLSWVTITSGASGTGNGTATYSVAANTSTSPRSGAITIADQTFAVSQDGAAPPCTFSILPTSATPRSAAASGSITVTASGSTCTWTAASSAPTWLTCSPAGGTGSGNVGWSASANTSTSPRTGTITVAGQTFTVTQDGAAASCTTSITPGSASPADTAANGSITVTASGSTCTWTAASGAPTWLSCSPASGTGSGTVSWSATANTGTSSRTGTLTVAGQTFTVTQAAASTVEVALANGIAYNDSLTAATAQTGWNYYYIDVPSGASGLVIDAYNMSADVDLYVKYNAKPTLGSWDCRPYIGGTSEQCTFNAPTAGRWWIGIDNWATGTILYTVRATFTQTVADTTPPSVPAGLTATAASSSQINLSWGASTDTGGSGLAGYRVYRGTTLIATTAATTYSDTGLAASSMFCYTVAAYDGAGNASVQSAQACATTSAVPDTTAPSVPTGLTATAVSSSQINLSWGASTDTGGSGLAGYRVYRGTTQIATTAATTYSDTGLAASSTFCYTVAAYDGAGNASAQSAQACATTSAAADTTAPTATLTAPTGGSTVSGTITLSANASDNVGVSRVEFYVDSTLAGTDTTSPYAVSYNTASVANGAHTVSAKAYDAAGNVGTSAAVSVTVANCSYSISPTSASPAATASSGTVAVTATAGCGWSASSLAGWITITSGMSGTGNGSVSYSVAANDTTSARTGTMTIAGKTFTVNQAAGSCTYVIAPTTASPAATASSGTVAVTANAGCAWTASSSAGWVTITAGSSGNGNGTVSYSVAINSTTSSRAGTLTIAGQTFTVTQAVDTTAPAVSLTSPAGSSTVSGTITVTATASDPVGISRVEFYRDNTTLVGTATAGYSVADDTTKVSNGSHTYNSKAYDMAGNSTTSAGIIVTVSNGTIGSWAKSFGSTGSDGGSTIVADPNGNIYVAGYFTGTIDLGSGQMTSVSTSDILLAKYSAGGALQWAKRIGGGGGQSASALALDASGNILMVGTFMGTTDLGGGPLPSSGGVDGFLAKYAADGSFLWGRQLGGIKDDQVLGLAVDSGGNAVVAGTFSGSADFGGGTLYSYGADTFLAKYSATGQCVWAKNFWSNADDSPGGVAVDSLDNIVLVGKFQGSIDFGIGALAVTGATDVYLAKFTSSGTCLWAQHYGGAYADSASGVAVDSSANIYITGYFSISGTFGSGVLNSFGGYGYDPFLAKYLPDGTPQWSMAFGGPNYEVPTAVCVDSSDNVWVTGYFQNTLNMGGATLTSKGVQDVFAGKYSASGAYIWSKSFGGTGSDGASGLAVDRTGAMLLTGYFYGSADFGVQSLTSSGGYDGFLLRLIP